MLTDRQKKVVKIIVEHDRGIYANEIAKTLKVSTRTIRNDIAGINLALKNSQCSIQSSKRTGYFIMQENINRIKEVLKTMDALNPKQVATSSKQRKYFILGKLMNCHAKDLGDMADELYVSEQTVYKDLTGMIHYLNEKYHFDALSLENGKMILQPKEIEIRTLVYRLIKEEIYLTNRLVDIHLYQMIRESADMEELNDIVDYISKSYIVNFLIHNSSHYRHKNRQKVLSLLIDKTFRIKITPFVPTKKDKTINRDGLRVLSLRR